MDRSGYGHGYACLGLPRSHGRRGDSNPRSFGDSTEFEDEEDRQAAMADYELDNTQGDYITSSDTLDDLFDEDDSCAFPPKL